MIIRRISALIIVFLCFITTIGCSKEPTMQTVEELFSDYYLMTNHKGVRYAYIELLDANGNIKNKELFDNLTEIFGTPSHNKLLKMCKTSSLLKEAFTETVEKDTITIKISSIVAQESENIVVVRITEH